MKLERKMYLVIGAGLVLMDVLALESTYPTCADGGKVNLGTCLAVFRGCQTRVR